jgi:hypothetical protein
MDGKSRFREIKGLSNAKLSAWVKEGMNKTDARDSVYRGYINALTFELDRRKDAGLIRSDAGLHKPKKKSNNPFDMGFGF